MAREQSALEQQARAGKDPGGMRGQQSAIQQGVDQAAQRLDQAGKSSSLLSQRAQRAMNDAKQQVSEATKATQSGQQPGTQPGGSQPGGSQGSGSQAAEAMKAAGESLQRAAAALVRDRERVNSASSASGFEEMVEQLKQLAGQQGQINQQANAMPSLTPGAQGQAGREAMRQLSRQQKGVAEQLEEIGDGDPTGRADALAKEARQLAQSMERQSTADPATLQRQQQLYRRLLEAGKSLERDERDDTGKREAKNGIGRRRRHARGGHDERQGRDALPDADVERAARAERGGAAPGARVLPPPERHAMTRRGRALLAVALLGLARALPAQEIRSVPLGRALELESTGKGREAVAFFRQALADPAAGDDGRTAAILGLERVWAELGQRDSLVPLVTAALRTRPSDPTLRGVQLRALVAVRRDAEARAAYEAWRRATPGDAQPYREFARLLLDAGRSAAADTVLREAEPSIRGPGGRRALALELAQLHAALGAWTRAGTSWRTAVDAMPYVELAAFFSLQAAPPAARDSVLPPLLEAPVSLVPRRVAAQLLLGWRRPREAWQALAALPADDSSRATWRDFADRLEAVDAWGPARDAWTRVHGADGDPEAARRAASAALAGGDAAGALALLERAAQARAAGGAAPSSAAIADAALLRVRVLAALGRAADAERVAAEAAPRVDAGDRARLAGALADAWVSAGDVTRARAALAVAGARDDAPVAGWLALYAGDLRRARALLKRPGEDVGAARTELAMTALAVVARTRADSAPAVGARSSAPRAATPSAPRSSSSRPRSSCRRPRRCWSRRRRVCRPRAATRRRPWPSGSASPRRTRDRPRRRRRSSRGRGSCSAAAIAAGVRARLEHLIVTYPESALVPIARRELEQARTSPSAP